MMQNLIACFKNTFKIKLKAIDLRNKSLLNIIFFGIYHPVSFNIFTTFIFSLALDLIMKVFY